MKLDLYKLRRCAAIAGERAEHRPAELGGVFICKEFYFASDGKIALFLRDGEPIEKPIVVQALPLLQFNDTGWLDSVAEYDPEGGVLSWRAQNGIKLSYVNPLKDAHFKHAGTLLHMLAKALKGYPEEYKPTQRFGFWPELLAKFGGAVQILVPQEPSEPALVVPLEEECWFGLLALQTITGKNEVQSVIELIRRLDSEGPAGYST
jgi:hypothetical protein